MQSAKIILKLLYKSSNWLIKFSFLALPLALFLSISSYLFVDNILSSYESYLVKSYIGTQGRISIESKDEKFIKDLATFSKEHKFTHSIKKEIKTSLVFVGDKHLPKYAKYIILDLPYIKKKFKALHVDKHTLFVNEIFLKSIGSFDISNFKSVYFDDEKKLVNISSIVGVNTGFLSDEPIVFISVELAKEIFGEINTNKNIIEFLESNNKNIINIKKQTKLLSAKNNTMEFKIHDLILDTKTTKEFFHKISIIEKVISFLIFILSMGIIILSISIAIEFKKNSLKTLQLIGMSVKELSITISFSIFLMMLIILGLCILSQSILKDIFLDISGFSKDFFIAINYDNIYYILLLSVFLLILNYIASKHIFSR